MQFEDILIGAGEDEFGNMCGFAPFPYFQRNIEVTCEDGVTPEYAAKSLQWLAQVDEALIREICQYACYYLQDTRRSSIFRTRWKSCGIWTSECFISANLWTRAFLF